MKTILSQTVLVGSLVAIMALAMAESAAAQSDSVTQSGYVPTRIAAGVALSGATAVNNTGQTVGWLYFNSGGGSDAFSWTPTGGRVVLTQRVIFGSSRAVGVNDNGQVVGTVYKEDPCCGTIFRHAFSWTPTGGVVDLGTLGGTNSEGAAINVNGQVTGWSETAAGP